MIRKFVLAAVLAASFGSIVTPANAEIIVRIPPPPLRVEVVPAPRPGYVWGGGHWGWRNNKHYWVNGSWVQERRGYHYTQHTWTERNGRWHMAPGSWRRGDRDGDGVPDRFDRAPNNPNRH